MSLDTQKHIAELDQLIGSLAIVAGRQNTPESETFFTTQKDKAEILQAMLKRYPSWSCSDFEIALTHASELHGVCEGLESVVSRPSGAEFWQGQIQSLLGLSDHFQDKKDQLINQLIPCPE